MNLYKKVYSYKKITTAKITFESIKYCCNDEKFSR